MYKYFWSGSMWCMILPDFLWIMKSFGLYTIPRLPATKAMNSSSTVIVERPIGRNSYLVCGNRSSFSVLAISYSRAWRHVRCPQQQGPVCPSCRWHELINTYPKAFWWCSHEPPQGFPLPLNRGSLPHNMWNNFDPNNFEAMNPSLLVCDSRKGSDILGIELSSLPVDYWVR